MELTQEITSPFKDNKTIKELKEHRSPLKDYTNLVVYDKGGGGGSNTSTPKSLPPKASEALNQNKSATHFTNTKGSHIISPATSYSDTQLSESKNVESEQEESSHKPKSRNTDCEEEEKEKFEDAQENKLSLSVLAEDFERVHLSTPGKLNTAAVNKHEFAYDKYGTGTVDSSTSSCLDESYEDSVISLNGIYNINSSSLLYDKSISSSHIANQNNDSYEQFSEDEFENAKKTASSLRNTSPDNSNLSISPNTSIDSDSAPEKEKSKKNSQLSGTPVNKDFNFEVAKSLEILLECDQLEINESSKMTGHTLLLASPKNLDVDKIESQELYGKLFGSNMDVQKQINEEQKEKSQNNIVGYSREENKIEINDFPTTNENTSFQEYQTGDHKVKLQHYTVDYSDEENKIDSDKFTAPFVKEAELTRTVYSNISSKSENTEILQIPLVHNNEITINGTTRVQDDHSDVILLSPNISKSPDHKQRFNDSVTLSNVEIVSDVVKGLDDSLQSGDNGLSEKTLSLFTKKDQNSTKKTVLTYQNENLVSIHTDKHKIDKTDIGIKFESSVQEQIGLSELEQTQMKTVECSERVENCNIFGPCINDEDKKKVEAVKLKIVDVINENCDNTINIDCIKHLQGRELEETENSSEEKVLSSPSNCEDPMSITFEVDQDTSMEANVDYSFVVLSPDEAIVDIKSESFGGDSVQKQNFAILPSTDIEQDNKNTIETLELKIGIISDNVFKDCSIDVVAPDICESEVNVDYIKQLYKEQVEIIYVPPEEDLPLHVNYEEEMNIITEVDLFKSDEANEEKIVLPLTCDKYKSVNANRNEKPDNCEVTLQKQINPEIKEGDKNELIEHHKLEDKRETCISLETNDDKLRELEMKAEIDTDKNSVEHNISDAEKNPAIYDRELNIDREKAVETDLLPTNTFLSSSKNCEEGLDEEKPLETDILPCKTISHTHTNGEELNKEKLVENVFLTPVTVSSLPKNSEKGFNLEKLLETDLSPSASVLTMPTSSEEGLNEEKSVEMDLSPSKTISHTPTNCEGLNLPLETDHLPSVTVLSLPTNWEEGLNEEKPLETDLFPSLTVLSMLTSNEEELNEEKSVETDFLPSVTVPSSPRSCEKGSNSEKELEIDLLQSNTVLSISANCKNELNQDEPLEIYLLSNKMLSSPESCEEELNPNTEEESKKPDKANDHKGFASVCFDKYEQDIVNLDLKTEDYSSTILQRSDEDQLENFSNKTFDNNKEENLTKNFDIVLVSITDGSKDIKQREQLKTKLDSNVINNSNFIEVGHSVIPGNEPNIEKNTEGQEKIGITRVYYEKSPSPISFENGFNIRSQEEQFKPNGANSSQEILLPSSEKHLLASNIVTKSENSDDTNYKQNDIFEVKEFENQTTEHNKQENVTENSVIVISPVFHSISNKQSELNTELACENVIKHIVTGIIGNTETIDYKLKVDQITQLQEEQFEITHLPSPASCEEELALTTQVDSNIDNIYVSLPSHEFRLMKGNLDTKLENCGVLIKNVEVEAEAVQSESVETNKQENCDIVILAGVDKENEDINNQEALELKTGNVFQSTIIDVVEHIKVPVNEVNIEQIKIIQEGQIENVFLPLDKAFSSPTIFDKDLNIKPEVNLRETNEVNVDKDLNIKTVVNLEKTNEVNVDKDFVSSHSSQKCKQDKGNINMKSENCGVIIQKLKIDRDQVDDSQTKSVKSDKQENITKREVLAADRVHENVKEKKAFEINKEKSPVHLKEEPHTNSLSLTNETEINSCNIKTNTNKEQIASKPIKLEHLVTETVDLKQFSNDPPVLASSNTVTVIFSPETKLQSSDPLKNTKTDNVPQDDQNITLDAVSKLSSKEHPRNPVNENKDLEKLCVKPKLSPPKAAKTKVSPKRNLLKAFQTAIPKDISNCKKDTFCEFFIAGDETNENNTMDFDERLAEEAANVSDHILNLSQEMQDSDSDVSDNNKTVVKVEEIGNICEGKSISPPLMQKNSPSSSTSNLKPSREIHNIPVSSQSSGYDSVSIESYMQSMRSVHPAHLNQSEAGPISADELSSQELEFQDGANLDLDYFTRVGSTEGAVRNSLIRDSLYVKFDPIVGAIVSKTVTDTFKMPPPSLPDEETSSEEQNEAKLSETKEVKQGDSQKTPGRSPALEAVQKLISLTPPSASSGTVSPSKSDRGTPSGTQKNAFISQEQLKKELKKLEDLMKEREIYFENELEKKQAHIDKEETGMEMAASRRVELEAELKAAMEREQRLKKEVQERTKSKQQLSLVMEEYEKTISQLVAQKEEEKKEFEVQKDLLMKERDTAMQHLNNMEIAFNDVHQKYERSKTVIEGMKANEDVLKRSLAEFDEAIKTSSAKYDSLKSHAIRQLETANQELDLIRRSHQAEIAKLKAMLKKSEVRVTSLEESLEQKSKENQELAAICDELINKVGAGST